jgi:hypothetical protein
MASIFQCDFCGAAGFLDRTALRCHQTRNGLCLSKQKTAERTAQRERASAQPEQELMHEDVPAGPQDTRVEPDQIVEEECDDELLNEFDVDPLVKGDNEEFDVTFQLVYLMRQFHNGGGLSQRDMTKLLRFLHHPKFDVKKILVHSVAKVCRYEQSLLDQRDDQLWIETELRPESESAPAINLMHRNALQLMENLYSSPKNQENFALHASLNQEHGSNRLYNSLQSGDWWAEMQQDVESKCEGGVVAPIILYSDQTSLANNRRTQGWPLVMTLGNVCCDLRSLPEGHGLLAVLPVTGPNDPGMSSFFGILQHICKDKSQICSFETSTCLFFMSCK